MLYLITFYVFYYLILHLSTVRHGSGLQLLLLMCCCLCRRLLWWRYLTWFIWTQPNVLSAVALKCVTGGYNCDTLDMSPVHCSWFDITHLNKNNQPKYIETQKELDFLMLILTCFWSFWMMETFIQIGNSTNNVISMIKSSTQVVTSGKKLQSS